MRDEFLQLSRRKFIGVVALIGAATAFGLESHFRSNKLTKPNTTETDGVSVEHYKKNPIYRYGTSTHNCGGRCIIKGQIENGRIVRFLTDESDTAFDGTPIESSNRNSTQSRACARCRAYRGRLYHAGRLQFPLKQTKERGDMTGFIRISWEQALAEITERLKAVQSEYGPEAFHSIYACGNIASDFQGGSYTGVFRSSDWGEQAAALRLLGGSTQYTSDYSFHQGSYMGGYGPAFTGIINTPPSADDVAGTGKYIVLWGANIPTTHNPFAYPWVKGVEDMKKRDHDAKVVYIGPELSESGLTIADEWIQSRPYTDSALILAMIHEMIVNTVNPDGSLKPESERWLDLDYIDTVIYGFFDSPEYYLEEREKDGDTPGTVSLTKKDGYTRIDAVPAGKSLSAYIMGNDSRLTKVQYGNRTYLATKFSEYYGGSATRNRSVCSYNNRSGNTAFEYKKDIMTPKTTAWASKITGINENRIKELAKMYIDAAKDDQPIWNEWSGGQLKQAEGCNTLFALQTLLIVSKNWGLTGTGVANKKIARTKASDPNQITNADITPATWKNIPHMPTHPQPSVTQWHNALRFAFGDQLKVNGYKHNIPDWKEELATGNVYHSDGGVKALITRHLKPGASEPATFTVTGSDGIERTYYDYEGRNSNKPKYAGFRFILNSAGNIPINQHANAIDSAELFKHLPTYEYEDGKYNVKDMKDAFYMVCFDNFMSPSAQYADYVLPAKTTWEQEDFVSIEASGTLYVDSVIEGPGESMSSWDFAREWIRVYGGDKKAEEFTGYKATSSLKDIIKRKYEADIKTNPKSPFYKKSWKEFLDKPFSPAKPSDNTPSAVAKIPVRAKLDEYLASTDKIITPFFAGIVSADYKTIYGFGHDEFAETDTCPRQSKRFHVYSGALSWRYSNLFSKWHGYLPLEKQGQRNVDTEGDPIVYPIVMYYDYRDYFREAYDLKDATALKGRYLLTTTHDRFRAHSSQAENPYLRELTHRTVDGKLYSGNDWKHYSNADKSCTSFPPLNELIGANGLPTDKDKASYSEIWVNSEDFANMPDGTLVKVENEIGIVYCVIRKTKRCIPGFVGLHQGCWFDPRTINGKIVDIGGNCNTLMASKPSRMDHGNAQQSAMVTITPVK